MVCIIIIYTNNMIININEISFNDIYIDINNTNTNKNDYETIRLYFFKT